MNLKKEIIDILKDNGKTKKDIKWVGCSEFKIPLETFWELCDTEYDSGYGAPKVAQDLIICGDDFWLERCEYDGSEWFEYKEMPSEPSAFREINYLTVEQYNSYNKDPIIGWETLYSLNAYGN